MSMKKTEMDKNMAKRLGGQLKGAPTPQRFGAASAQAAAKKDKPAAVPKAVPLALRLPADLAARLRERATQHEGGVNTVVALALEQWLAGAPAPKP
jgi:uncharacterized protein YhdP